MGLFLQLGLNVKVNMVTLKEQPYSKTSETYYILLLVISAPGSVDIRFLQLDVHYISFIEAALSYV